MEKKLNKIFAEKFMHAEVPVVSQLSETFIFIDFRMYCFPRVSVNEIIDCTK